MLMRSSIHRNFFFGSIFVVIAFIGLISAGFFPAHAASATCFDITGQGEGVDVNGVPNSGVVHFDPPLAPDVAYEACVEDDGTWGPGLFTVKGWAWNDNLGWISMYCADEDADGPPYENLGIPCGNFIYGAKMDSTTGRLSGHAWGDNSGWVSFNCSDGVTCGALPLQADYWVEPETTELACQGRVFSLDPFSWGCLIPNDDWSVYAWSENVGWIDFTGVNFPWDEFTPIAVDVTLEITPDPMTLNKQSGNLPVADGLDGYTIKIHITDPITGLPIDDSLYETMVQLDWEDTVNVNQTDAGSVDCELDPLDMACAVTKTSGLFSPVPLPPGWSAYGLGAGAPDAYSFKVTSLAPTSGMNGYDNGADGSVDFSYEQFVLGGPAFLIPSNSLVLKDVSASVKLISSGQCAFGGVGCVPLLLGAGSLNMEFNPAVEVSEMNDSINGATITGAHLTPNHINYQTAKRGTLSGLGGNVINFQMGVDPLFKLVIDLDVDGADCHDPDVFDIELDVPFAPVLSLFDIVPVFDFSGPTCAESGPPTGENAFIYSTVSYTNGGKVINYFSNKLPRVQGTLVVNPVAEISGNVYSTGVTNPQTGQEVRSLGDVSTNILRNTLLQNVRGIVAGADVPSGNPVNIVDYDESISPKGFQVNLEAAVSRLIPDLFSVPKVYYFKGDTTIAADLSWSGERTIIVDGGDLYIDRNLYNVPGLFNKLGIIVLDNLATPVKEGNIYVAPNVTNIQANMYADGSFFSYDGNSATISASGEPIFADEAARFNALKNQLFIEGSLASQNTIGGAVKTLPILGDGTELNSGVEGSYNPPSGRARARLYDLNFLRYYGLVFERDINGDAVDKDLDGTLEATPYTGNPAGGDLVPIVGGLPATGLNPAADFAAVYINFNPPSLTLPAFGSSGGVDIRIRP